MAHKTGKLVETLDEKTALPLGLKTPWLAAGYVFVTKEGIPLEIVAIGLAGTPGPYGAPADNASFTITANVAEQFANGNNYSFGQAFTVLGSPDPAGGRPCSQNDTGEAFSSSGTLNGSNETFTETIALTCQGSYKQGHIVYKEIAISDTLVLGDGTRCASAKPFVYGSFDGTFGSASLVSGVYYSGYFQADCTDGSYIYRNSAFGTWTGSSF